MKKLSSDVIARRLERLPNPTYQDDLPVHARREEIKKVIDQHQVVIICGETGSGKTTQIPKICLELKRGVNCLIGHTQPRRIAARTVAARIASELNSPLGQVVGYKIRFTDKVSSDSYIKLMTDGILLAETQGDPLLQAYDTLIIDEAHERSLNIDFLLGYLSQVLVKRPDLKLIVTAATIDAQRFSKHFNDAPVIEVTGRLYPVEICYRPLMADDEEDGDLQSAILASVDELMARGSGDILVFLPGEREIRETAESLRKHHFDHSRSGISPINVLPLFARLSVAEQEKVFQPEGNTRRIVLATNVAETSLTVPGIHYVIDGGLARINRYSYRNKVEQLLVEKISQASANQRAGRCGRIANGVCMRLYSEQDFQGRPEFTDPEILRSSLPAVILRMKALKIGDIEDFPILEAPSARMISDGYQLLAELGAVDENKVLTALGWRLSKFPIDPRVARMILAAKQENCLHEILIIAGNYSDSIQGLNSINGHPDCDDFFPDSPNEFERAISEGDSIKFYCCEVGPDHIQTIILRVYQLDINGNRDFYYDQEGNPLLDENGCIQYIYNECMINVEVQDKIKPTCVPPAHVTVSCQNSTQACGLTVTRR